MKSPLYLRLAWAEDPKDKWQRKISEIGENSTVVFTDGNMKESGGMGAGWWR